MWAAGVKASPMGRILADKTGAELDRIGRVKVQPDLSLPGFVYGSKESGPCIAAKTKVIDCPSSALATLSYYNPGGGSYKKRLSFSAPHGVCPATNLQSEYPANYRS